MTITVAAVAGLIVGLMLGATVAGLALTERRSRHWVVCLRLPQELHRRLREEATVAEWSLKAEIISRLQVVDRKKPRLSRGFLRAGAHADASACSAAISTLSGCHGLGR